MKAVKKMLRALLGRSTQGEVDERERRERERERIKRDLENRLHDVTRRVHVLEWQTDPRFAESVRHHQDTGD